MKCFLVKGTFAGCKKFKWLNVAESKVIPNVWIDVISQPDRERCSTELIEKCCSLQWRLHTPTAPTHTLCLIYTAPVLAGGLGCRHPNVWQNKSQTAASNGSKSGQINGYVVICLCIPMSLLHLCVFPQIYWADFANSGGSSASKGTLPSLQSGPVEHLTGAGSNPLRRPAEQLCWNGVALYYQT